MSRYILCLLVMLAGCHLSKKNKAKSDLTLDQTLAPNQSVYHVQKCKKNTQINIDGLIDPSWKHAILHTDFEDQWYHKEAGQTSFRALWDTQWLYFIYDVEDNDIVLEQGYTDSESNAVRSDRVEIFLGSAIDDVYYAFEMDADARVYDSKGEWEEYSDGTWDMPATDIQLASSRHDSGYILEGKLALQKLRELDVLTDQSTVKAGLFRGDYSSGQDSIVWISWGKADSSIPNFHLLSALREVRLVD